jgi:uncharacterized protein (DUF427 family)
MKPVKPAKGQESVWDYPRPPRLEPSVRRLRVCAGEHTIAQTTSGFRILETSHPPTYYIPPADIDFRFLKKSERSSFCEYKGRAGYLDLLLDGKVMPSAAWFYSQPAEPYAAIRDHVCFYASISAVQCYVDEEQVQSQAGDFYGGWITRDIVGPFKGGPGTFGW